MLNINERIHNDMESTVSEMYSLIELLSAQKIISDTWSNVENDTRQEQINYEYFQKNLK